MKKQIQRNAACLITLAALLAGGPAHAAPTAASAASNEALPAVSAPAGFEEGTETQLSADQMSQILPWAENSETMLQDLLETTRSFSYVEARDTLVRGIQDLVLASAPKRTELLMRYVLNRALKVYRQIEAQVDTTQPGVVDLQVRMLRASVALALKYYQSDLAYLNGRFVEKKTDLAGLPYATFGLEYAQFLMTLDQSLFDASAQYEIATVALGLLQWDLYRDKDRLLYAPVIAKIDRFLKLVPRTAPALDADSVKWLRRVKKVYQESLSQTVELMGKSGKPVPPVATPEPPATSKPASTSTVRIELGARSRVYPDEFSRGYATVIGIHSGTGEVTVAGSENGTYYRYKPETIAFPNGCLNGVCVGERVIPEGYGVGYAVVIAINPIKETITVLGNESTTYHRYTPDQFGFTKGCYSGFCVGDRVLPESYRSGYATVVSVNPSTGKITVLGNESTSYHRFMPVQLIPIK